MWNVTESDVDAVRGQVIQLSRMTVTAIRSYVRAQLDQWRRVPWLEFEAHGKRGYSDASPLAYKYGYVHVHRPGRASNVGSPLIDCATGELVVFTSFGCRPPSVVSDAECLKLALEVDRLNAAKRISELEASIAEGFKSGIDRERYEEWRERTLAEYGVKERFDPPDPRRYPDFHFSVD